MAHALRIFGGHQCNFSFNVQKQDKNLDSRLICIKCKTNRQLARQCCDLQLCWLCWQNHCDKKKNWYDKISMCANTLCDQRNMTKKERSDFNQHDILKLGLFLVKTTKINQNHINKSNFIRYSKRCKLDYRHISHDQYVDYLLDVQSNDQSDDESDNDKQFDDNQVDNLLDDSSGSFDDESVESISYSTDEEPNEEDKKFIVPDYDEPKTFKDLSEDLFEESPESYEESSLSENEKNDDMLKDNEIEIIHKNKKRLRSSKNQNPSKRRKCIELTDD